MTNYPSNVVNAKSAIALRLYFSRVGEKIYAALDGNKIEMEQFGMSAEKLHDIGFLVEGIAQELLGNKNE